MRHPFSRTRWFVNKYLEPIVKLEAARTSLTKHVGVMKGLREHLLALLLALLSVG